MSYGLTPYDFVQQVYYAQEKVLLDFHPDDDKYKEVLMEANLVLQELQKEEDWTWLRERLILGSVAPLHKGDKTIPEFELPDWVYKVSTLHNDCVRLHHHMKCRRGNYLACSDCPGLDRCIDQVDFIEVPFASTGYAHHHGRQAWDHYLATNPPEVELKAITVGNVVTFNRPLLPWERDRIAVVDVQRRIGQLHICTPDCPRDENGRCTLIEDRVFTEIPDPNYVVIKTAAYHAEGSPPAAARAGTLNDQAQKLLSAMRQNDTAATDADMMDWEIPGYFQVV